MAGMLRKESVGGRHGEDWVTRRIEWPKLAGLIIRGVQATTTPLATKTTQRAACFSYYLI